MGMYSVRQWRSPAGFVVAVGLSAFLAAACSGESTPELDLTESAGEALTDPAIVIAWNDIAVNAAFAFDNFDDFSINARGITMMHLAMHDALNSIDPVYERYALTSATQPLADPTAAAAQAARDVLVNIYPDQQGTFDSALASQLGGIPDPGKSLGIQVGNAAAAAVIARRVNDRMDVFGEFTPTSTQPGVYQFVPPFDFVFRPAFGDSVPFGITSGTQFRPGPPPNLGGGGYRNAYNEVKAFGVATGSSRSADQTHLAFWWFEFSEIFWNRLTNQLVRERDVDLYPAARMFALVNMAVIDSYVAVWNAKRFYNAWRPFTAIRAGATDGNNGTAPDPAWEALCLTPPTWEYPSAHAMQSAAAAEVLVKTLGTNNVSFTTTSTTAPPGQPTRSFTTLRGAAAEGANSRVMCGIHFRFATDAGLAQGRALGNFITANRLKPLDD